jgi:hypothetical protein
MQTMSIVSTIKASLSEIIEFIEYHLGLGVQHFYIYLDDSDDVTTSNVLSIRYADHITTINCSSAYWFVAHHIARPDSVERRQTLNAMNALDCARTRGDTWIAHIDVDEYIYLSGCSLAELLASSQNADVIRMGVYEAIPNSLAEHRKIDIRYFKHIPFDIAIRHSGYPFMTAIRHRGLHQFYRVLFFVFGRLANVPGFNRGFYNFYNAHSIGKSITRVSEAVHSLNLHGPSFKEGYRPKLTCFQKCFLLHFESHSFDAWLKKWSRRSLPEGYAAGLDGRQKQIWDIFQSDQSDIQNLESVYKSIYCIDPLERRLFQFFRCVRCIDLS